MLHACSACIINLADIAKVSPYGQQPETPSELAPVDAGSGNVTVMPAAPQSKMVSKNMPTLPALQQQQLTGRKLQQTPEDSCKWCRPVPAWIYECQDPAKLSGCYSWMSCIPPAPPSFPRSSDSSVPQHTGPAGDASSGNSDTFPVTNSTYPSDKSPPPDSTSNGTSSTVVPKMIDNRTGSSPIPPPYKPNGTDNSSSFSPPSTPANSFDGASGNSTSSMGTNSSDPSGKPPPPGSAGNGTTSTVGPAVYDNTTDSSPLPPIYKPNGTDNSSSFPGPSTPANTSDGGVAPSSPRVNNTNATFAGTSGDAAAAGGNGTEPAGNGTTNTSMDTTAAGNGTEPGKNTEHAGNGTANTSMNASVDGNGTVPTSGVRKLQQTTDNTGADPVADNSTSTGDSWPNSSNGAGSAAGSDAQQSMPSSGPAPGCTGVGGSQCTLTSASGGSTCGVIPAEAAKQAARIPMFQGGFFPYTFDDSGTTHYRSYNLLPDELESFVGKHIHTNADTVWSWLYNYLPVNFGCPGFPLLEKAMNGTIETDHSTGEYNSLIYYVSWQPKQLPDSNYSCWVDAGVAANLVLFIKLEQLYPCSYSVPYACKNFTVYWQAPNSPCIESDRSVCASKTFHFSLPTQYPCDEADIFMTGQAVNTTYPNGTVVCWTRDPELPPANATTEWKREINWKSFLPGGILSNDILESGALYPVPAISGFDLPAIIFSLPMESYAATDYALRAVSVPGALYNQNQPWCNPGDMPCAVSVGNGMSGDSGTVSYQMGGEPHHAP